MAAGFRGARPALFGKSGSGVAPPPPVAISAVLSPLDRSATFSLETTSLGLTIFDRAPKDWDTVQKEKVVSTRRTWSSSAVHEWPVVTGANGVIGIERVLGWELLSGDLFKVLRDYYESTEQITWDPGYRARVPGEKYYISFSNLTKDKDFRLHDYAKNVKATFNIRGIAS